MFPAEFPREAAEVEGLLPLLPLLLPCPCSFSVVVVVVGVVVVLITGVVASGFGDSLELVVVMVVVDDDCGFPWSQSFPVHFVVVVVVVVVVVTFSEIRVIFDNAYFRVLYKYDLKIDLTLIWFVISRLKFPFENSVIVRVFLRLNFEKFIVWFVIHLAEANFFVIISETDEK